ncbi:helix-turn-helix transcriptional regulator, partial [Streptomyces sp. NPDC001193]
MPDEQESLFAAVDALLEEAAQDPLPHPDERKRLREAAGLSQDQIAKALSVRRETVTSWETGRTAPRAPKRAAYARLLEGLSTLHPLAAYLQVVRGYDAVQTGVISPPPRSACSRPRSPPSASQSAGPS